MRKGLENRLKGELLKSFNALKFKVTKQSLQDGIAKQFQTYTSHGNDHIKTVVENAIDISRIIQLEEKEVYCLLSACYCHDLGMAHTGAQDLLKINDSETLRRQHAYLSGLYVREELKDIITEDLREAIAKICESHGRWDWDNKYFDNIYNIRIRLLSAILSLADVLDLRSERKRPSDFTDIESFLNYAFLFDPLKISTDLKHLSHLHWLRHYYSQKPSIEVDDKSNTILVSLFARIQSCNQDICNPEFDRSRPLIEEIIQSEVVNLIEYDLFKKIMLPYNVKLKKGNGCWPTYITTTADPFKWPFPRQFTKLAFKSNMIRSKYIELQNIDEYYKNRIEPFISEDDFQASITWKPGSLAPNNVLNKYQTPRRNAIREVQKQAIRNWDFVLWAIDRYVTFLETLFDKGDEGEKELKERLLALTKGLDLIADGVYKKYFIPINGLGEPVNSTQYVAKCGYYDVKPGGDMFTRGEILVNSEIQKLKFKNICNHIAQKLGVSTLDEYISERLLKSANEINAYEISLNTFQEIFQRFSKILENKEIKDDFIHEFKILKEGLFNNKVFEFSLMTDDQVEDVLKLERLSSRFAWEKPESFRKFINLQNAFCLMKKDQIIGYILVDSDNKDYLLIVKMAIDINYFKRGYGYYLLTRIEKITKQAQYKSIVLHVRESNLAAINLYKKKGFKIVERIEGYYTKTGECFEDKVALKMQYYI